MCIWQRIQTERQLRSSVFQRSKCTIGENPCLNQPRCHKQRRHTEGGSFHFSKKNDESFLASAGWCTHFMWHKKLVLRQKTKICQRHPADLEEKITSFRCFVIHQRLRHSYLLSQIGNMDETPVFFYLPSNRTMDSVGWKSAIIRTMAYDKTHFTAVLACMADGTNSHKRKTMPKEKFPASVIIYVHPKGWIDTDGILI